MPLSSEEKDIYLEKLLKLQYEASDFIKHKLTKGELREKFIKNIVSDEYPRITIKNGILTHDSWQSTQGDFLWLKSNARVGSFDVFEVNDCHVFMEIKSKMKKEEIDLLDKQAAELKRKNKDIKVGAFCYSTSAKKKTILKNQGFVFDKDLLAYDLYNRSVDLTPNIDFFYCLNIVENEVDSSYYIQKDISGNKIYFSDSPVIKHLMNILREL